LRIFLYSFYSPPAVERSFQSNQVEAPAASDATRERILAAAADLFATRGFAGTSIAEIRKASGASASSIYWEFGNKEGILAAVLERSAAEWHSQAGRSARRAWEQSQGTGRPPLEVYFADLADQLTERPEFLRLLLLLSLERREVDPTTIEAVRRVRAGAVAALAKAFRLAGVLPESVPDEIVNDIARTSLAFADGAFVAVQIDPDSIDLRRMFAIFYAGLAAALGSEGGDFARAGPAGRATE
jgi:AcrR family transcriptional regulator